MRNGKINSAVAIIGFIIVIFLLSQCEETVRDIHMHCLYRSPGIVQMRSSVIATDSLGKQYLAFVRADGDNHINVMYPTDCIDLSKTEYIGLDDSMSFRLHLLKKRQRYIISPDYDISSMPPSLNHGDFDGYDARYVIHLVPMWHSKGFPTRLRLEWILTDIWDICVLPSYVDHVPDSLVVDPYPILDELYFVESGGNNQYYSVPDSYWLDSDSIWNDPIRVVFKRRYQSELVDDEQARQYGIQCVPGLDTISFSFVYTRLDKNCYTGIIYEK